MVSDQGKRCYNSGMRWSIRNQLLVPLLTLLLGVVGMAAWTALASAGRVRQQIEKQVHDVAITVNEVTFPRNLHTLKLIKGLSGAEFLLCDAGKKALLGDRGEPLTTLPSLPAVLPDANTDWQALHLGPRVKVGAESYFCQGIPLGQERLHLLYIFYPETQWREALWDAIRPALIFGVFVGCVALALTILVAQRFGRRIQEMERRTRLIAAGDFSPMPLPARNDELRDLGLSVNEMAQRLAQFQEAVKRTERLRLLGQVSGGLAHQLRNGVTGARLAVQLHLREANAHGNGEALDVALRQLALVEMHLKRFLDLGRSGESRREPCRPAPLLTETITLLRPQCQHAGIDLSLALPDLMSREPILQGDADQLRHLFLNVLQNATEAAGPGGWVRVRMELADGQLPGHRMLVIEVEDSGPGPGAEVAERLFEPFVTGRAEGVGLGLAVARQVAESHAGTIAWKRHAEHTCFRIELPVQTMQTT